MNKHILLLHSLDTFRVHVTPPIETFKTAQISRNDLPSFLNKIMRSRSCGDKSVFLPITQSCYDVNSKIKMENAQYNDALKQNYILFVSSNGALNLMSATV